MCVLYRILFRTVHDFVHKTTTAHPPNVHSVMRTCILIIRRFDESRSTIKLIICYSTSALVLPRLLRTAFPTTLVSAVDTGGYGNRWIAIKLLCYRILHHLVHHTLLLFLQKETISTWSKSCSKSVFQIADQKRL